MKKFPSKISTLVSAIIFALSAFLFGCQSDETTQDPSSPREILGLLKYTGATYSPVHFEAPYKYAIYDINGKFVAYVDTTRLVIPRMDTFMGRYVIVRGQIQKLDGESVMRAENIILR